MSTMSMRFPYKERRVGKITKIGLTRLTSTPLMPTGSKAEACQPLRAVCAAMARSGGRAAGAIGEVAEARHPPHLPL